MWGISFEKALADFVENERSQMDTAAQAELLNLEENLPLVYKMLKHYRQVWKDPNVRYNDGEIEHLAVEREFTVPLIDGAYLSGRFDGIVQDLRDHTFWIFETKTTRSITEYMNGLHYNFQSVAYMWAAKQLGDLPIKGVLYNLMKKSAPSEMTPTSSGLLPRNKSNANTWHSYMAAIKELHPDFEAHHIEEYYGDHLYYLRQKPNEFFTRIPFTRTDEEIEHIMDNVKAIARDMISDPALYPNYNWMSCNFCMFKNLCNLTTKGYDLQSVLNTEYRRKVESKSFRVSEENGDA